MFYIMFKNQFLLSVHNLEQAIHLVLNVEITRSQRGAVELKAKGGDEIQ